MIAGRISENSRITRDIQYSFKQEVEVREGLYSDQWSDLSLPASDVEDFIQVLPSHLPTD